VRRVAAQQQIDRVLNMVEIQHGTAQWHGVDTSLVKRGNRGDK
jgi:hypothetical protein